MTQCKIYAKSILDIEKILRNFAECMKASVIIRFILLGLLWAGLVAWIIIGTPRFTLYTAFVIVASAIIIFVPVYKKYVKNAKK